MMPSPPPDPPPLSVVLKDRNENFAADETVDELKQCHTHTQPASCSVPQIQEH